MSEQNADTIRTSKLSSAWRNSHPPIRSYIPSVKERNDSQMVEDIEIHSYLQGSIAFKLCE